MDKRGSSYRPPGEAVMPFLPDYLQDEKAYAYDFCLPTTSSRGVLTCFDSTATIFALRRHRIFDCHAFCARQTSVFRTFVYLCGSQLLIYVLLVFYVFLGAVVFYLLDDTLANDYSLPNLVLFSFTTLATIGYGNISPHTKAARIFCMIYSTVGVPLCFALISNLSRFVRDTSLAFLLYIRKKSICRSYSFLVPLPQRSPIPAQIFLCATFALWALLLRYTGFIIAGHVHTEHMNASFMESSLPEYPIIEAVYVSVVTFSTVGFGDYFPVASSWISCVFLLAYLFCGIVAHSSLFSSLHRRFRFLHNSYLRRRSIKGWTRRLHSMTPTEIATCISEEFGIPFSEVRSTVRIVASDVLSRRANNNNHVASENDLLTKVGTSDDDDKSDNDNDDDDVVSEARSRIVPDEFHV